MTAAPTPHGSEDQLLEQWSFLDSLADRQAASLRAGTQDSEEVDVAPSAAAGVAGADGVTELRQRIAVLEREADALRAQLEGRERDLARSQTNGTDLMVSLREAHAAVEQADHARVSAERRATAAEAALHARHEASPAAPPQGAAEGALRAAEGESDAAPASTRQSSTTPIGQSGGDDTPAAPPDVARKPSFLARLFGRG